LGVLSAYRLTDEQPAFEGGLSETVDVEIINGYLPEIECLACHNCLVFEVGIMAAKVP
jgi:hypothetical protein